MVRKDPRDVHHHQVQATSKVAVNDRNLEACLRETWYVCSPHDPGTHVAVGEEGSCSTSEGHLCRDDRGERLAVEGRAAQNEGVELNPQLPEYGDEDFPNPTHDVAAAAGRDSALPLSVEMLDVTNGGRCVLGRLARPAIRRRGFGLANLRVQNLRARL